MTAAIIILVFLATYVAIAVGRLPWVKLDRTGIAMLGVIALIATRTVTFDELNAHVDAPTLILLFALMIISEQFVIAGFVDRCILRITTADLSPRQMLALTVAVNGALAAVLTNDVLVLVSTPLLLEAVRARGLNPKPYLLALIGASNAGSAATILGAPQNIVIGQLGDLGLFTYLGACLLPAMVALAIVYLVVGMTWRGRLHDDGSSAVPVEELQPSFRHGYDRRQTIKALIGLACLLGLFATSLPHDIFALAIMALMMLDRRVSSGTMIAAVDWPLLILFYCLFAITGVLGGTGFAGALTNALQDMHLLPTGLALLAPLSLVMSNTIGNVPFAILLLQVWQDPPPGALYGLALLSSLAANLLLGGSLSNLLIIGRAAERGVVIRAAEFARVGVPIALLSMLFAVFWLAWTGFMPWLPP